MWFVFHGGYVARVAHENDADHRQGERESAVTPNLYPAADRCQKMHAFTHCRRNLPRHTVTRIATLLLTDPTNPCCFIHERSRTRTRLSARLRSHDLDRALASGASPDSSAVLSLRAHTLIGATFRDALAHSIRGLIEDAGRPLGPFTPGVPICRRKILGSRESLEGLARRLLNSDPVEACGVAEAHLLLSDGSGPAYGRPSADDLEVAVQHALRALELRV